MTTHINQYIMEREWLITDDHYGCFTTPNQTYWSIPVEQLTAEQLSETCPKCLKHWIGRAHNPWVSVDDYLPEWIHPDICYETNFLLKFENGHHRIDQWSCSERDGQRNSVWNRNHYSTRITHWMPIHQTV